MIGLITINKDIDTVTSILNETLKIAPFKRDYDTTFRKIAIILKRYNLDENPRNLRFRFTLFMQEFFDSIPQDKWKLKDPKFIKEAEDFAVSKFKEWILDQVT